MRKVFLLGLASLFIVAALGVNAFAFEGSFVQKMSLNERVLAEYKVAAKGDKVRMEILNSSQPEMILENEDGNFRVYPSKSIAIKMPAVEKRTLLDDLDDFHKYLQDNKAQKIGSEQLGDHSTEVFTYIDPMSRQEAKAWILADSGLPVKIEIPTPDGLLKVEFSKYDLKAIDDSQFLVPEGTKVVDQSQVITNQAAASKSMQ